MNIENDIFNKCIFNYDKLIEYGFVIKDNKYIYNKLINNNDFNIVVEIINDNVTGRIYDVNFNEEYKNFRVENMNGDFVGSIRNEFINLLNDIKKKCTNNKLFMYDQSIRITEYIKNKYNDDPDFKWNDDNAVFFNSKTKKWYGALLVVDKSKLINSLSGKVEVLNLKLDPNEIIELLDIKGFYKAYHMNKKYWVSILLDDSVDDSKIFELIDESFSYSC